jgi:dihydroorotase
VFTAPIALAALTSLFDKHDALDNLQAFVSTNAQNIYAYKPTQKDIELVKKPFKVVESYADVVPMFAGEILPWSIKE